jgi:hypothetical protein
VDPLELDRLERVRTWGLVPPPERTDEWVREFEAAFWPSLVVLQRFVRSKLDNRIYQVITSYSEGNQSSPPRADMRPKRAAGLVDELIQNGCGLFFTNENEGLLCGFTIAEIVSYRLYGRAFTPAHLAPTGPLRLERGAELGLSAVHEALFPNWARINVRRHLQQSLGIAQPRAVWANFPDGRSGVVFDLEGKRIADEALVDKTFTELGWFMPRRIPFFRLDMLEGDTVMSVF